ncbi:hypothetical protein M378DRAFT_100731 [Amanita muscaria Koide BX008]|uniref:BZIP domain-containing protein n=1 Tax=Amanita muscaria (strain Koide BX008) TaxID=946122 RepID=A0A0C2SXC9_AMAMK|nr:hypothetical protein M378DRAFT_100731 [Amanita muscaria Koide BX008]
MATSPALVIPLTKATMPDGQPRDRSASANIDDSDFESQAGDTASNPPGKPGRKKNPNSQTARRDQNRIAQREFRLRKQQRIRDLEARVELLSGGKDEAISEMRNILKDLMAENHTLRGLLKSLAAFIGDGTGGLLPKLGWDVSDFNSLMERTETDTAWESYQRRKKVQQQQQQQKQERSSPSTTVPTASSDHKRPAEGDHPSTAKRARMSTNGEDERLQNGFPLAMSMNNPSLAANPLFAGAHSQDGGMFQAIMRGSGASPMFMHPSPPSNASSPYGVSGANINYQPSYASPGVNLNIDPSLPTLPFNPPPGPSPVQRIQASVPLPAEQVEEDDQSKNEAYKLITYHLDNFKRNANYCLPASLRPTLVQRTVPHESVIDRILHPDLRDRMILLRGRYDLVDCLFDYRNAVTIHGDDVLAHSNWEINEKWLRQYGFLADQITLNVCNRWRRERGEPELSLADVAPPDQSPTTTS